MRRWCLRLILIVGVCLGLVRIHTEIADLARDDSVGPVLFYRQPAQSWNEALPHAWKTGSVTGLRARGGFVVALAWRNGALERAVIRSKRGNPCTVRYGETTVQLDIPAGDATTLDGTFRNR
jgi:hypothetical protein